MYTPLGDVALVNGRVITMNPDQPEASAVAIRAGRVIEVGTDADVRAAAGPRATVIDLRGRTATPGLNDAHAHPMIVGFALLDLDLAADGLQSIADIVRLVESETRKKPHGSWIVGRGYDQARLTDQRHPTRHDLDAISPHHPVLLIRACHHIGVANSAALALAGVTANTRDPEGGTIDRDDHGESTGVLRETAFEQVKATMGDPSVAQIAEALELGGRAFNASGVTSAVEAGIDRPEELQAYQLLRREGRLPFRAYLMMMIEEMLEPMEQIGLQTGMGDDWLRIGPAKLFSDGSIGGRTARMRFPYEGQAENVGLWMEPPAVMKQKIMRAHKAGFQIGIHAIGDAAIDLILDGYEAAMAAYPRPNPRHRVEHCSIIDRQTIERIARMGVIPIPGTSFLYHFRDAYVQNLGMERIRYAYGMKSFADHGIIAAASTDAPVVPTSATIGLQTMLTRRDMHGREMWAEEAIDLDAALRAYTWNGAYASFEETIKGSLEAGKVGDVTVFETDLRSVAPGDLGSVRIDYTIADGRVVHARD